LVIHSLQLKPSDVQLRRTTFVCSSYNVEIKRHYYYNTFLKYDETHTESTESQMKVYVKARKKCL